VFLNLRFLPLVFSTDFSVSSLKGLLRFYELPPPVEFPGLPRLRATRKEEKWEKKERRKRPAFDFSRKVEMKRARCDWSAHRVFRFLFAASTIFFISPLGFFLFFLSFFFLFLFHRLITNPTVGGCFSFVFVVVFVCISLSTFSQSVVHVVLHLIIQFEKSRLFARNLKSLSGESGSSRQLRSDGRLQLTR